jgi:hypothetical protein
MKPGKFHVWSLPGDDTVQPVGAAFPPVVVYDSYVRK